jgi:hypothetical protein
MPSVANKLIMLSAVMLDIIMLSVVMLNVLAPFGCSCVDQMSVGQTFFDQKTRHHVFLLIVSFSYCHSHLSNSNVLARKSFTTVIYECLR